VELLIWRSVSPLETAPMWVSPTQPWPQSAAPDLHLERARDRWAAPELLGAPTIGGGSAWSRGGGGGDYRSQISLQSRPKSTKTAKTRTVSRMFWLLNRRKRRFSLKST
jgi:hypothetical protein